MNEMTAKINNNAWQPILRGDEAERTLGVVEKIAEALRHPPPAWIPRQQDNAEPYRLSRGASMSQGSAGIALFYAYLAKMIGHDTSFLSEADRYMNKACDVLETVPMEAGLYRGLSGIAWAVQHLQGLIYDEEENDSQSDANVEIDQILLDHWSRPSKFDLWEGAVGLGIYALERYPLGNSRLLLELVVNQLYRLSTADDQGTTWFTPPEMLRPQTRQAYPQGFYDLGVAHGVTGVVSFFSRVDRLEIEKDIVQNMLYGAGNWLLAQKQRGDPHLIFPQFLMPPDNKPTITHTFGWCHGDIGVAAALLSAARCCGESTWEAVAIKAAHASIDYLENFSKPEAFDSTLCHGTAGLSHLFNRIYQTTGIERFKEEARKWLNLTLDSRKPGTGIAGYSRFGMNEEGDLSEQYDPGFIQGTAGIGLALLAAATHIEPQWDRLLLISAPETI